MFKRYLPILAMALLAIPAATGVYQYLALYREGIIAGLAALGIELTYISLAWVQLDDGNRNRAKALAAFTAAVSILYNLGFALLQIPTGIVNLDERWRVGMAMLDAIPMPLIAVFLAWLLLHPSTDAVHTVTLHQVDVTPAPPAVTLQEPAATMADLGDLLTSDPSMTLTRAAELLGISRQTASAWNKKLTIAPPVSNGHVNP